MFRTVFALLASASVVLGSTSVVTNYLTDSLGIPMAGNVVITPATPTLLNGLTNVLGPSFTIKCRAGAWQAALSNPGFYYVNQLDIGNPTLIFCPSTVGNYTNALGYYAAAATNPIPTFTPYITYMWSTNGGTNGSGGTNGTWELITTTELDAGTLIVTNPPDFAGIPATFNPQMHKNSWQRLYWHQPLRVASIGDVQWGGVGIGAVQNALTNLIPNGGYALDFSGISYLAQGGGTVVAGTDPGSQDADAWAAHYHMPTGGTATTYDPSLTANRLDVFWIQMPGFGTLSVQTNTYVFVPGWGSYGTVVTLQGANDTVRGMYTNIWLPTTNSYGVKITSTGTNILIGSSFWCTNTSNLRSTVWPMGGIDVLSYMAAVPTNIWGPILKGLDLDLIIIGSKDPAGSVTTHVPELEQMFTNWCPNMDVVYYAESPSFDTVGYEGMKVMRQEWFPIAKQYNRLFYDGWTYLSPTNNWANTNWWFDGAHPQVLANQFMMSDLIKVLGMDGDSLARLGYSSSTSLPANVARTDANNNFSVDQTFQGAVTVNGNVLSLYGSFWGTNWYDPSPSVPPSISWNGAGPITLLGFDSLGNALFRSAIFGTNGVVTGWDLGADLGFVGLMKSGGVTNSAGSRVAYLSDTTGSLPGTTAAGDLLVGNGASWGTMAVGMYRLTTNTVKSGSTVNLGSVYVPTNYLARIRGDFAMAGSTNFASSTKSFTVQNSNGVLSASIITTIASTNSVGGASWTMTYATSGSTNVLCQATGSAAETWNGQWQGWVELVPMATEPPVLSGINISWTNDVAATVAWTTDQSANSTVEWGATSGYGSTTNLATLLTSHSIGISNLSAATTYHYRVSSTNANGQSAVSGDNAFVTASGGFTPADLGSKLKVWNKNESLTGADGTRTGGWADSTANGYFFTNALTYQQPYVTNTGTFGSGKKSLFFTATRPDLMTNANTSIFRNIGSATVVIVMQPVDQAVARYWFNASVPGGVLPRFGVQVQADDTWWMIGRRLDADSNEATTTAAALTPNTIILEADADWANSDAYTWTNSVAAIADTSWLTAGNTSDTDSGYIGLCGNGTGSGVTGWVAEVLICVPRLTSGERDNVYTYLNNKFTGRQ